MTSSRSARSRIDALEPRLLLAADFARVTSHGTLLITGDANSNVIRVSFDSASNQITVAHDGQMLAFNAADIGRVFADGGSGNDLIDLSGNKSLPTTLHGGRADDTIIGGPGKDRIYGDGGNDIIDGRESDDTLTGGAGQDVAEYHARNVGFTFTIGKYRGFEILDGGSARSGDERDGFTDFCETISGTAKDDRFVLIHTGYQSLVLQGHGGDDSFSSSEGNSYVTEFGDAGNDSFGTNEETSAQIFGGTGNDFIGISNAGPSYLDAGPGVDTFGAYINLEHGFDLGGLPSIEVFSITVAGASGNGGVPFPINGTAGDDDIRVSGYGRAVVDGGGGNNITFDRGEGDLFAVTVAGGAGDDTIVGTNFPDSIEGGAGDDSIDGGDGTDTIRGGPGNDTLVGGLGKDRIYGSDGDDTIFARDNAIDRIYGGGGNDSAQADQSALVQDVLDRVEITLA